jgi:hypothetical protein
MQAFAGTGSRLPISLKTGISPEIMAHPFLDSHALVEFLGTSSF